MDHEGRAQCPNCPWTGQADELEEADGEYACPACGATVLAE